MGRANNPITGRELAAILGISHTMVRKYVKRGMPMRSAVAAITWLAENSISRFAEKTPARAPVPKVETGAHLEVSTERPRYHITDGIIYEADGGDPEWFATPLPEQFLPCLRALCELWRGVHPKCPFALCIVSDGQYTFTYVADLAGLANTIERMNQFATRGGITIPWRLEMRSASKAALSMLLRQGDATGAAPGTN